MTDIKNDGAAGAPKTRTGTTRPAFITDESARRAESLERWHRRFSNLGRALAIMVAIGAAVVAMLILFFQPTNLMPGVADLELQHAAILMLLLAPCMFVFTATKSDDRIKPRHVCATMALGYIVFRYIHFGMTSSIVTTTIAFIAACFVLEWVRRRQPPHANRLYSIPIALFVWTGALDLFVTLSGLVGDQAPLAVLIDLWPWGGRWAEEALKLRTYAVFYTGVLVGASLLGNIGWSVYRRYRFLDRDPDFLPKLARLARNLLHPPYQPRPSISLVVLRVDLSAFLHGILRFNTAIFGALRNLERSAYLVLRWGGVLLEIASDELVSFLRTWRRSFLLIQATTVAGGLAALTVSAVYLLQQTGPDLLAYVHNELGTSDHHFLWMNNASPFLLTLGFLLLYYGEFYACYARFIEASADLHGRTVPITLFYVFGYAVLSGLIYGVTKMVCSGESGIACVSQPGPLPYVSTGVLAAIMIVGWQRMKRSERANPPRPPQDDQPIPGNPGPAGEANSPHPEEDEDLPQAQNTYPWPHIGKHPPKAPPSGASA
jgi:hypothetical protein